MAPTTRLAGGCARLLQESQCFWRTRRGSPSLAELKVVVVLLHIFGFSLHMLGKTSRLFRLL
ncbi:hypothetical protein B9Q03_04955 [Candidatus Marsarchaeota G2 archaeon OSP_D]|uniref:Uncharacterized protein n=1 Tax=Candidatus Marsarchaeota G2 archaeon OSP_D TaxID=1978157 RepID=A0A2R6AXP0_9ARCH|nr:MAG: hypothetical protein B9Q03_04955 [Candidatus Marsarchaeota G2 archaeon OSP_D]